jgi:hypothetical protein
LFKNPDLNRSIIIKHRLRGNETDEFHPPRFTATLGVHDQAYQGLTQRNDPVIFREFPLNAPDLVQELGERLRAVDQVSGFWRSRFPSDRPHAVTGEELLDIFSDFEFSLNYQAFGSAKAA